MRRPDPRSRYTRMPLRTRRVEGRSPWQLLRQPPANPRLRAGSSQDSEPAERILDLVEGAVKRGLGTVDLEDDGGRYVVGEDVAVTIEGGRRIIYQRRRFLPQGSLQPTMQEVTVTEGTRLDLVAYQTLGDPEQYWRIADANNAMDPEDLVAYPGRRLKIPLPTASEELPQVLPEEPEE
ncbi:MAG: hypothetical protein AAGD01_16155 [Acidobacteriota bacterium]